MRKMISLFTLVVLLSSVIGTVLAQEDIIPEITRTQFQPLPEDLRNYRYCEVLPIFLDGETLTVHVYNTIGLNDCPDDAWQTLDADTIAEEYDAFAATLNGPRYWVMNEIAGRERSVNQVIADFGGIEMMKLEAQIETRIGESVAGEQFYTENQVQRETTFIYWAGNMVYELTSPEGEVYRMQSYSQIVDETLTVDDLENLGERLDLPEGWQFEARTLTEDAELVADGLAYIIQDGLANTYQKINVAIDEQAASEETMTIQPFDLCPDGNCSDLNYHNGYWVTEMENPDLPLPVTIINDMHVDTITNSVTVYAQALAMGQIIAPPQVGPDECTENPKGETICYHPNAVYLNGSGAELMEADGTGSWWIKHAWILDGEGYMNCEAVPQEAYNDCFWVEGVLLDDGLSMKIGGIEEDEGFFNIRTPLLDEDPIAYQVTRYAPANLDAEAGDIDLTPTGQFVLTWHCEEEASAFDNQVRACPIINN